MNYNGKQFQVASTTINGSVDEELVFVYQQQGDVLTCTYEGGKIRAGQLLGLVAADGSIDMRYHQVLVNGELQTGHCQSTPEIMENGKIRLHEKWCWTSGDCSQGTSILMEV